MAAAIAISDPVTERRDAFVERMFEFAIGAFNIFTIHLGDRLGYYEALAENGPLTPEELARRTDTAERYAREWLEQQTVAGIVAMDNVDAPAEARRFYLPAGHDEALAGRESLNYMAPLAQAVVSAAYPISSVAEAFRTGKGVPFGDYGPNLREGLARMNRTAFLQQLGTEWIPAMPDVHERLSSEQPARVADFGCGAGWSAIGLAMQYPNVRVDGYDLDQPSIEMARRNAFDAGVADRVRFEVKDAGDPNIAGQYDLVMAFECIHDMPDPVAALKTMRRLTKSGGTVFIMDERTGDRFDPSAGAVERLQYGFSVLHCLPAGMADQPSCATGTVMRPETFAMYAELAGFDRMEIAPIDHLLFRFYRLHP